MKKNLLLMLFATFGWQQLQAQCPAGTIWTSRTSAANSSWWAITYGNGVFVSVANGGTFGKVMTSPDGITWTSRTAATDNAWTSVTYGNGLFVAVAGSGTGNRVMTSPDGITWTSRTSASDPEWSSVTYGNGLFVAVAFQPSGNGSSTYQVMTSPNGITWTNRNVGNFGWNSVTYGNGVFVAVGTIVTGYKIMTSPDGITWTGRTSAVLTAGKAITYGNGLFVCVYSNQIMTSPDGITWTSRTQATSSSFLSVTYGNGLFVAVPYSGTGKKVVTSPDGITWTVQNQAANNSWTAVTCGNGVFVAVSKDGLGNRVMTSSLRLVTPSVTIGANPGNSITTGTSVTFTATPTDGGTTPVYQWKKNGNNVGSDSVTYTDEALASDDIIICVLTSNDPCASPTTATSAGITMAVAASTTITKTGSLSAFTSCSGTASAEQGFTVSGANLTENIVITPPTGFELSTTSGSGFTSSLTLTQSGGSVAATAIYVRLSALASGTPSGDISCVSTGATSQIVAVSGTVNPTITPTFTQVAAIFSGASLSALPTTSNNAITGAWSPALNNSTTTTYTFTPASGQCATTATMTITINDIVAPIFTSVAPICLGGSLSALPTTSDNGITGTWSPALNNLATTLYTFTPTAGQNATTTTLTITVNPNVTPELTGNIQICAGESLADLPTTSNDGITGTWSPALDNTATKTYTFTPTAGQCALTTTLTIYVNSNVTPTFTEVAPICVGGSLDALPSTSEDCIPGTWSPALNNLATTTYTFLPSAGQCANIATLSITVNPIETPTFTAVAAICSGATLSALPLTSNNGVTGTWSPALDNMATTTYTFTPDVGQCASTATLTINVTVSEPPTVGNPSTSYITVIITGECSHRTGVYIPIGLLNGKNNYALGVDPSVKVGYDGAKWVLYENDDLNNVYFENTTVLPDLFPQTTGWSTVLCSGSLTTYITYPTPTFCDGATIANLDATGTDLKWYDVDSGGTALAASTVLVSGNYFVTQTIAGCESARIPLSVIITPPLTPTFTEVDPICSGAALSALPLTSNNGITGTWLPALNNLATTTYTFTPDAGQQCAVPATMTITVNSCATPTFTPVSPICAGESLAALPNTSNNGITGTWSPSLDNTTTTTYTFTPDEGQYATTATLTINVTVIEPPIVGGATTSDIAVTITGECSSLTGEYTFIGLLNGKNHYAWSVNPNLRMGYDGAKWVLYEYENEDLSNTGFESTTHLPGLFPPATGWSATLCEEGSLTYSFINANQTFCDDATIANLDATGTDLKWYNVASGGTALAASTVLVSGNYFVTQTIAGCESARALLSVIITPTTLTPTFSQVSAICSGASLSDLPTTSNDGITGTWSPALNNMATTIYTFTPDAGQCANPAVMTITVNHTTSPTADSQTFWGLTTINQLLANGTDLKWYTEANLATVLSPTVEVTTGTYYVSQTLNECESDRTAVAITVNKAIPNITTAPSASEITYGQNLSSSNLTGGAASVDGSFTFTNPETTPVAGTASQTVTFTPTDTNHYDTVNFTINVTVNKATPIIVTNPTASAILSGQTLASSTLTGGAANLSGGQIVASVLLVNSGPTRLEVVSIVKDLTGLGLREAVNLVNAAPVVVKQDVSLEEALSIKLSLEQAGATVVIQSNSIDGTFAFTTPSIAPTVGLTAQSVTFTPTEIANYNIVTTFVDVMVNGHTAPPTASAQTHCIGATAANLLATGTDLKWYAVTTSGIALTSSTVLSSATYYVSQTLNGIESDRIGVTVTLNPLLKPTFKQIAAICSGTALAELPLTSLNGIEGTWSPAINNLATTTYTFTPNAGQCGKTTTMKIFVRDPGTTGTIAGGDVTVYAPGTALNSNGISTLITNSTTLTLNGNSPGSIIQWQKSMNYVNATNATPAWSTVANVTAENNSVLINGKTLTVSNLTSTTWYRVQVTYGSCVTYANITKITVSPLAQAGVVTCLPSVCSGGSISFTSAAYTGNAIAWEVSTTSASAGFSTVAGENGLTYTMNNAPSTTFYVRSVVTSGTFSIARSAVKTVTVNPISVAGTITGGGTFCSGSNKSLKIAGCKGAIQWMFSTDGTNFMNVPIGSAVAPTFSTTSTSSSASSYVVNNISGTTFFKAVVKSGLCSSAETNVVVFNTATTATATSLSVESAQVCSGSATSLYIPLNVGDLKFQKSTNWSSATPTWTTVNLKMTQTLFNGAYGVFSTGTLTQSTAYRVVSSIGNCAPVAYSDMAVIGVQVCAAGREVETSATITTPFEVIAYPNPSNNMFNFKVNGANDDEVSILVFDMMGRQIDNKVVKANNVENLALGQNYASGVYNVIVAQGMNTKTVRLVKR